MAAVITDGLTELDFDPVCSVEGCGRGPVLARGWCAQHYHRWHRFGTPTPVFKPRSKVDPLLRFMEKITLDDGCWKWTGSRNAQGYGAFGVEGRTLSAHRFAYERLVGEIPEGLVLDHLCRNESCVNPDHLEPVTQSENQRRGLRGYALRALCRSGLHDITDPANVTVHARGARQCRPCLNESKKRSESRVRR